MNQNQAALVICEAIREAAKHVGCKPSEAHDPATANRDGIQARNRAIVQAHRQGVPKEFLSDAFRRSWETINNVILQDARNASGMGREEPGPPTSNA